MDMQMPVIVYKSLKKNNNNSIELDNSILRRLKNQLRQQKINTRQENMKTGKKKKERRKERKYNSKFWRKKIQNIFQHI